jgi:hypothetical protein
VAHLLGISPQRTAQLESKLLFKLQTGVGVELDTLRHFAQTGERNVNENNVKEVLSWPLAELDLPERVLNVLEGGGAEGRRIVTVGDYLSLNEFDYSSFKGLGTGSRGTIGEAISRAMRLGRG